MTHVIKVNWVSIKWSESSVIKTKKFDTQTELNKFRKNLELKSDFKLIGESRDVEYEKGYDCYENLELN